MVDYWARSDIHTLGNMGIGGAVHAAMAPIATKVSLLSYCQVYFKAVTCLTQPTCNLFIGFVQLIDVKAYGGRDVRALVRMTKLFLIRKYCSEANSIYCHTHL